jgi:hypothetical protein
MIPVNDEWQPDFEMVAEPTRTFRVDQERERVVGMADGREAVEQAIYFILNTERYEHIIYSWNYGVELNDLFGQDPAYVMPELKRRISEALMQDDRIQRVDGFAFEVRGKRVACSFVCHTIYGMVEARKEVNI